MSRGRLGLAALGGLAIVAVALAAPGPALVPAASEGNEPGWLLGVFGGGLGIGPGHRGGGGLYLGLLIAAFVLYLVVCATAPHLRPRLVWGAIAALIALFILAPPLLSQDVFSYIAYGRLGAEHGLNPYDAIPADRASDPVFAFVGWRDSVSAYGPLFTLGTYPLGLLGVPAALWALKALLGLSVLGLAALSARLAAARGAEPLQAAALVALNPLVLVHVVGGAHNDGLMMAAAMWGIAALALGSEAVGGARLVLAAGLKASAAFAVPFAVARRGGRRQVVAGLGLAAVAVAAVALAAFGSHASDALRLVGENQALTSRYSLPSTLSRGTGLDIDVLRPAFAIGYGLAVVGLVVWTARGADWIRAAAWAALGLLLASAWLLPWYVIWVLPLAAVARDRRLTFLALALCAFQLVNRVPL